MGWARRCWHFPGGSWRQARRWRRGGLGWGRGPGSGCISQPLLRVLREQGPKQGPAQPPPTRALLTSWGHGAQNIPAPARLRGRAGLCSGPLPGLPHLELHWGKGLGHDAHTVLPDRPLRWLHLAGLQVAASGNQLGLWPGPWGWGWASVPSSESRLGLQGEESGSDGPRVVAWGGGIPCRPALRGSIVSGCSPGQARRDTPEGS